MNFDYDSSAMAAQILEAANIDALEPVLARLTQMPRFVVETGVRGFKLFMHELDAAIPHIGSRLALRDYHAAKSNDNVVIVATQFYAVGGHSRIAADISRLVGSASTTIVLTDLYGKQVDRRLNPQGVLLSGFHCRSILGLKAPTALDRVAELHNLLHAIRPTRIFVLAHHMDLVAAAATYPFRTIAEFIHHADSVPSVGATMPYSAHVDLTTTVCSACQAAGMSPILTPMSLPPVKRLRQIARPPSESLVIATCGHPSKYLSPGAYRWTDWVVAALQAEPTATMVHIGPTEEAFRAQVAGVLAASGLEPSRYAFAGARPDLRQELAERGVNLYIVSYPDGGLRSLYEAMSIGIPALTPRDPSTPPLYRSDPGLPGWATVGSPSDMAGGIAEAKAVWPSLQTTEYAELVRSQMHRFEDYVALRPSLGVS